MMGNLSEVLRWEIVTARGVVATSPFFVEALEFYDAEIERTMFEGTGFVLMVERSDFGSTIIGVWNPNVKSSPDA